MSLLAKGSIQWSLKKVAAPCCSRSTARRSTIRWAHCLNGRVARLPLLLATTPLLAGEVCRYSPKPAMKLLLTRRRPWSYATARARSTLAARAIARVKGELDASQAAQAVLHWPRVDAIRLAAMSFENRGAILTFMFGPGPIGHLVQAHETSEKSKLVAGIRPFRCSAARMMKGPLRNRPRAHHCPPPWLVGREVAGCELAARWPPEHQCSLAAQAPLLAGRELHCSLAARPGRFHGPVGRSRWPRQPLLARWCATARRELLPVRCPLLANGAAAHEGKLPVVVEEGGHMGWSRCSLVEVHCPPIHHSLGSLLKWESCPPASAARHCATARRGGWTLLAQACHGASAREEEALAIRYCSCKDHAGRACHCPHEGRAGCKPSCLRGAPLAAS
ncbi:hypothetical protein Dimus_002780 [Dionaea muscipula]